MRKWILLGLVGLLLWYIVTQREGYQDTPSIVGAYNKVVDAKHVISLMPASLLAAIKKTLPKQPCPNTKTTTPATGEDVNAGMGGGVAGLLNCEVDETTDSGALQIVGGDINNVMGAFYLRVYQPANAALQASDVDRYLMTYPMTPFLTANKNDIKTLLVAYFISQPSGATNAPLTEKQQIAADAATVRGYRFNDITDTYNGPLQAPINERRTPGEKTTTRPTSGPVFGANGPFSGNAGTGQGTAMNAAAMLTGNTYGSSGQSTTLDPYSMYPAGGKPKAPPPGTNLPVKGPPSGGLGVASTTSSRTSQPAPTLYGPTAGGGQNMGWGHPKINSGDTSALPSFDSSGSEPNSQYAATSRVPGDMDLFPNPFIQSTSYSLANGKQKTDPVPFLTDFSAFQN